MNLILVKRDSRLSLSRSLDLQGECSTLQDHIPLTGHEGSGLGCSKVGLEQVGKHLPFPPRPDSSRCSEILKIYRLWLCYCSLLDVLELAPSPSGKVPKLDSPSRELLSLPTHKPGKKCITRIRISSNFALGFYKIRPL